MDDRIDRLVNIDFGGRNSEFLYHAARELHGRPLVLAAAESLAAVPHGATVLMTTGSVSRAWITSAVGENDGPAGAAAIARALVLGLGVTSVVYAEERLLDAIGAIFRAAGMSIVSMDEARKVTQLGGGLACVVLRSYPVTDEEGSREAIGVLNEVKPALLFSTERAGRNVKGIYHSATGRDFGKGRSRIDYVFDEGHRRGIPSIGVGDGGNEIGMGLISEAVARYIPYGATCQCGCGGGIAATTKTDILVTSACSNWGCYGIAASLAGLLRNPSLLHTASREQRLLTAACRRASSIQQLEQWTGMWTEFRSLAIYQLLN